MNHMNHIFAPSTGVLMKRSVLLLVLAVFSSAYAYAADDPVARAMKLYEKRHYEEAAVLLRAELPSLERVRQGAAQLTLGMIYLKNAELYRALQQESVAAAQDYLKKLTGGRGKDKSRFADLYMGQTLIEAGKSGAAIPYLEKFIADENVAPLYRAIAKANLGLCHYLGEEKQKAESIWSGIDSSSSEVIAELAFVYSRAGLKDKNPAALCDQSVGDFKKIGKPLSTRIMKNCISVYGKAGLTDNGLEVLKRSDARSYSYKEVLGRSKVINFYEISVLGDIAVLYGQASKASLEKAAADATVKDVADYYLSAIYAFLGNIDLAEKVGGTFISSARMPPQQKDRIRVKQAEHEYRKGRQTDAMRTWNELTQKQPTDPDLLAEVLFACGRARADCGKLVKQAVSVADSGQGKKFYALNYALGKYYLSKSNNARAVSYMEAGRDKSNKNKIESNDPLMLVDLAGLYYRSKKFSEALEIYFELSKQFPAVRQIQEAMQGVYATEQKSAGDVKIF
jgi:tetratricopeptide (TPR) repeat protein